MAASEGEKAGAGFCFVDLGCRQALRCRVRNIEMIGARNQAVQVMVRGIEARRNFCHRWQAG